MDVAPDAVLYWDRGSLGPECERAAIVRAGVETYLGRPVFAANGKLLVRVNLAHVEENGRGRVVAKVTQEDGDGRAWGERIVSGEESCDSLDEPLTLVVALMVDGPPAAEAPLQPSPQPPVVQPPAARDPRDVDETPREILTTPNLEQSLEPPEHAAFLCFGLASMGLLPEAGAGVGFALLLKPKAFWGFGVEAAMLVPQELGLGSGRLEVSFSSVRASLCPLQGIEGGVWWSACASFGVGRLTIDSHELIGAMSRTEWIPLPSAGARAAWLASKRWMLAGGLEAAFPVSPDRYVYRDVEGTKRQAFEMSSLGLTVNLGVGLIFD